MKFIITGHGNFATGLTSSVKLITGLEKALMAVDFEESMSSEDLKEKLTKEIESDQEETVVIFTDIAGGTPFNQSVLLRNGNDNIEIVAGTNLPILVEAVLSPEKETDALLSKLVASGQNNIKRYEEQSNKKTQDTNGDEGI
ncbi:MAG: PTS galactosamine/N-acetylgalactosamine transporter subunit IIA [Alkalibacterium gilvum]|uniref:PTS galactosamine/N-acetylgalactosamine transporter subunit IIA n=1 Tax=Alkalibacterium gilvum TaxID=1130080 RepID=UPI0026524679|nr:PTS sugar transporter subunit IIA [Alkalibacterium sp.]MDN6729971.1 PTS sugar transporter subunit IIA [Alkalibacterium sp.]